MHPHLTFTADLPSVAHCFPLRQLAVFTNRRCQPARCTVRPGCFHAPHHSPRFSAVLFLTLCILRGCPRDRITLKRPSAKFLLSPVSFTSSLGLLVPPGCSFSLYFLEMHVKQMSHSCRSREKVARLTRL